MAHLEKYQDTDEDNVTVQDLRVGADCAGSKRPRRHMVSRGASWRCKRMENTTMHARCNNFRAALAAKQSPGLPSSHPGTAPSPSPTPILASPNECMHRVHPRCLYQLLPLTSSAALPLTLTRFGSDAYDLTPADQACLITSSDPDMDPPTTAAILLPPLFPSCSSPRVDAAVRPSSRPGHRHERISALDSRCHESKNIQDTLKLYNHNVYLQFIKYKY